MFIVRNRNDEAVFMGSSWSDAIAATNEGSGIGQIEEGRLQNEEYQDFIWNFKGAKTWQEFKTGAIRYE
jgi:hypothetical protein